MGVPQQCVAKFRLQAFQLTAKGVVVRAPDLLQVSLALIRRRHLAILEQRFTLEQRRRVQAGGSTCVQRLVVVRAVQVDDEARVLRGHHTGAHFASEVVQARDVPVGIRQALRLVDQPFAHRRGQFESGVRHADQQGQPALVKTQYLVHLASLSRKFLGPCAPRAWAGRHPASRPGRQGARSARRRSPPPCRFPASRGCGPDPGPWRRAW
ncbi:hypothetical protein D3C81_651270 [compost metagenome]